jgi:ribosomal-protein-alanine N-acetyltransferase
MPDLVEKLLIQNMQPENVDEVVAIEKQSFSDPWSEESFLVELDLPFSWVWVAKIKNRLTGYCCCWEIEGELQIANLAVHPEFRNQGIGKKILQEILNRACQRKVKKVTLEVRESNQAALKLYRGFDFSEVGRRKKYYRKPTEDGLILAKILE